MDRIVFFAAGLSGLIYLISKWGESRGFFRASAFRITTLGCVSLVLGLCLGSSPHLPMFISGVSIVLASALVLAAGWLRFNQPMAGDDKLLLRWGGSVYRPLAVAVITLCVIVGLASFWCAFIAQEPLWHFLAYQSFLLAGVSFCSVYFNELGWGPRARSFRQRVQFP